MSEAANRPVVVMGVSGSGKSTVAELLAVRLGSAFVDADGLHPPENIAKLASGTPLTDDDRAPWLTTVGEVLVGGDVVVACSALKRSYRDLLRRAAPDLVLVHLHGEREMLAARLSQRVGHFMPVSLLDSQLATLEALDADEPGVVCDIADPPDVIVDRALAALRLG